MQQKLRAVFRSSSKKKNEPTEKTDTHSDATSPRSTGDHRRATSLDERRHRRSLDSHNTGAQQGSRNRPLSSAYDSRRIVSNSSGQQPVAIDHAQNQPLRPTHESIASDYRAYLPVLSPVEDLNDDSYVGSGGGRRLTTGKSERQHEEDVAHQNIDQHRTSLDVSKRKPLPATPGMCIDQSTVLREAVTAIVMKNYVNGFAALDAADQDLSRNFSTSEGSFGSTIRMVPSSATGKYSVGGNMTTKGGLVNSTPPHKEEAGLDKNQPKDTRYPSQTVHEESHLGSTRIKSQGSESEDDALPSLPEQFGGRDRLPPNSGREHTTLMTDVDGQGDIEEEIEKLLNGVVDLSNTVDEDKDVQWAPGKFLVASLHAFVLVFLTDITAAVTHEVVKPHEHEIVQQRVYREIHNYEYYHHIQPVYDIEVLPPRHWIPNPNGAGLIEISADELPSRTGSNRRWKIIHEEVEPSSGSRPAWRTEPEIIEHPTTITHEGFERKETTIIYPPTLQDMTEYDGLVQPVHFDHKTGKQWLGELTTMHQLRQELGQVADPDLSLKELAEALHNVPDASDVPDLSQSPEVKRKPLNGPVHAGVVALERHEGIAVAV
jgi:hypothetical protein